MVWNTPSQNMSGLERVFPRLGYRPVVLPKLDVAARADFVLAELKATIR